MANSVGGRSLSSSSDWAGWALAALGAYELAAEVVNDALDEQLLPSFVGGMRRFRFGTVVRRLSPPPVRTAMILAAGVTVNAVADAIHGLRAAPKQSTVKP